MRVRSRVHGARLRLPFFLTWLSQWILWLILADNYGVRELLIGASASAIGAYFTTLFASRAREHFKFRARDLAQAIYIPEILFSDTWILLVAIKRQLMRQKLSGGIVSVRFLYGDDAPGSRARRALAITYLTLTPNSLVLGIAKDTTAIFPHDNSATSS